MENGNALVEAVLVNSSYCSAPGKYILGIKAKVLGEKKERTKERKDRWEKKFKIKILCLLFRSAIFYTLKVRLYLCSLPIPILSY